MDHVGTAQIPHSAIPGTKKEKKKQVKDELDRLRQAEKKKRRLEKALATSAAIRSELEKKKQRKKEEQQRLDEEGAAIAESVALHVLGDEDSEEPSKLVLNKDEGVGVFHSTQLGFLPGNSSAGAGNTGLYIEGQKKDTLYQNYAKCCGGISYSFGSEGREIISDSREPVWQWNEWKLPHCRAIGRRSGDYPEINGREHEFGSGCSQWKNFTFGQKRVICDEKERASVSEVSVGLIAAQAVAALRIAEEARAEAKVAKKAAEAAMNGILDRSYLAHQFDILNECKAQSRSTDRDMSRTQLQETEQKLREKTLQGSVLEQNQNGVIHHFYDFEARFEGSMSCNLYWLSSS
eukprot:Gb_14112 [translate_table: standard]